MKPKARRFVPDAVRAARKPKSQDTWRRSMYVSSERAKAEKARP